jgi:hypothetical protein
LLTLRVEFAERGAQLLLTTFTQDAERHFRAGRRARHQIAKSVRVVDFDTIKPNPF